MRTFLERLGADTSGKSNCLVITKERHENTYLSARNIPFLNLRTLDNINARDILRAKKVVVSKSALGELKGLGSPPAAVLNVTAAVTYMLAPPKANLKKIDVGWKAAQKMMNNPTQFLESIVNFNANEIPDESLNNVAPLLAQAGWRMPLPPVVPISALAAQNLTPDAPAAGGGGWYPGRTLLEEIDAIPKSASGKILRRELRAPFWQGRDRQVN